MLGPLLCHPVITVYIISSPRAIRNMRSTTVDDTYINNLYFLYCRPTVDTKCCLLVPSVPLCPSGVLTPMEMLKPSLARISSAAGGVNVTAVE